jgi:hypothetical protein
LWNILIFYDAIEDYWDPKRIAILKYPYSFAAGFKKLTALKY